MCSQRLRCQSSWVPTELFKGIPYQGIISVSKTLFLVACVKGISKLEGIVQASCRFPLIISDSEIKQVKKVSKQLRQNAVLSESLKFQGFFQ